MQILSLQRASKVVLPVEFSHPIVQQSVTSRSCTVGFVELAARERAQSPFGFKGEAVVGAFMPSAVFSAMHTFNADARVLCHVAEGIQCSIPEHKYTNGAAT